MFLWAKTKADLQKEMDGELQMPGWGNVWTQPIINRVNMLATGVRTQIGVKVFGPTRGGGSRGSGSGRADRLRTRCANAGGSDQIAAKLQTMRGAADVVTDQAMGKRYVEIRVDRETAAAVRREHRGREPGDRDGDGRVADHDDGGGTAAVPGAVAVCAGLLAGSGRDRRRAGDGGGDAGAR